MGRLGAATAPSRERQRDDEGREPTARAKADDVRRLKAAGKTGDEIAAELEIGRASVFRILQAHRANH